MVIVKDIIAKWIDFASNLSDMWVLKAVRKGLIYNLPLVFVGSLVLMILNLPVVFFQDIMNDIFGVQWRSILLLIHDGTLSVISICVLIGIAYAILQDKRPLKEGSYLFGTTISVVVGCFLLFVKDSSVLPQSNAESTGLFLAMIFSVIVTSLFLWFYNHRLLKIKMEKYRDDNMMNEIVSLVEPAIFTFGVVALAKYFYLELHSGQINMHFLTEILENYSDFTATIIFETITQLLWFFGFHGSNILETVTKEIFRMNSSINIVALLANGAPTQIFTKEFLDIFVYLGGSGSSLCLVAALLLRGSKNGTYKLAKFSLLPALFNINELIIFGLPVVFNLFFLIPFIVTPIDRKSVV